MNSEFENYVDMVNKGLSSPLTEIDKSLMRHAWNQALNEACHIIATEHFLATDIINAETAGLENKIHALKER